MLQWQGDWDKFINSIPKVDVKYFGRPVTSANNLGVRNYANDVFHNCNKGDYVKKINQGYKVIPKNEVKRTHKIKYKHETNHDIVNNIFK